MAAYGLGIMAEIILSGVLSIIDLLPPLTEWKQPFRDKLSSYHDTDDPSGMLKRTWDESKYGYAARQGPTETLC